MAGSVRGVLFDLDGTLLDHESAVKAALLSWLPGFGLSRDESSAAVPVWLDLEQRHYPAWRAGEISFQEQRRRRVRDFLPSIGVKVDESEIDRTFGDYLAAYEQHWTAYDDAYPTLRRVAEAGLRVGVLTNGLLEQQRSKLAAVGLLHACGEVFASSALSASKPDPRAYLEACAGLDLPPSQVVMVGDQYDVDVIGARAAGLQAVHLDRSARHCDPNEPGRVRTLLDLSI